MKPDRKTQTHTESVSSAVCVRICTHRESVRAFEGQMMAVQKEITKISSSALQFRAHTGLVESLE